MKEKEREVTPWEREVSARVAPGDKRDGTLLKTVRAETTCGEGGWRPNIREESTNGR